MILRKVVCDIPNCDREHEEVTFGAGFSNWGSIHGVKLNGKENPYLCPEHLAQVMQFIDERYPV